ncbi:chemotaxis protein CheB [Xanthobacter agilis]|uniref:protein-glutamate methylesterase n=1 Tax=Xanthobacter agilis TaxID=47492 RepID=A0ABU0LF29_XANAG|nr:chemotaxis protein CheB [Xanthobacter agilis]MDQ0505745.1 two-component system chemotaxis response regulator CheB [Xanthobacter agilis]
MVIGASAGGPGALQRLLRRLDPALPAAVVVVNHVGADGPDLLADVLARRSALPVVLARERMPVTAGRVHVAPSGYHLQIEPGRYFSLSVDPKVCFSRPSIDVLFETAARAYQKSLIGVVLTGASSDGAEGLAHIRQWGGQALVQAPDDAEVPTMPRAALERAGADLCAPIEALADHINKASRS